MKPGFTFKPTITPVGLSHLLSHIQKDDPRLFDALTRGTLDINRAYELIRDHENRLINLEKGKPRCSIYRTTDLAIPTSGTALTVSGYDAEDYDNDDMYTSSINNDRLLVNTPGYYDVGANLIFASNATGYREVRITHTSFLTGTVTFIVFVRQPTTSGANHGINVSRGWRAEQNDYFQLSVVQTSGASLDLLAVLPHAGITFWAHMDDKVYNPEDIPFRITE